MSEVLSLFIFLLVGVFAGFLDSVVGAGGLFSVPLLIFLGLPPQVAIATDRFGTIGQTMAALFKFQKYKKILWNHVPLLTLIAFAGSLIGANILLNVEQKILQQIVGVLLFILLPFIFTKQDLGVKHIKKNKIKIIVGILFYFIIMVFSGFFGQGTGPLIFYVLVYFWGFTMVEVLATGVIPWFVLSISSLIIFAVNGIIDYYIGLILFVGMVIGGYFGAYIAVKKGDLWIKRIFIIFIIIFGIKLLFF